MQFVKMHGLGNDFAIFDGRKESVSFTSEQVKRLADRRYGIGFDLLCVLRHPRHPEADVFLEMINPDGLYVSACGNLTRCVGLLIAEETKRTENIIETNAGLLRTEVWDNGRVSVRMGPVSYEWQDIPLSQPQDPMSLQLLDFPPASAVSVGNPHCVFFVDDLLDLDIYTVGPLITRHPLFPEETNVEIAQIINRQHIQMHVWERSLGYSVACGTGACAVASIAHRKGLIDDRCQVHMPGGILDIHIPSQREVIMIGEAQKSFSGDLEQSLL